MGRHIKKILKKLYPYLGTEGWFISGSYANKEITCFNDIDIFFKTKKHFDSAVKKTKGAGEHLFTTDCSISFKIAGRSEIVQYIHTRFGTPEEIFDGIDINVCRQGILPDGTHIQRPESKDPLEILAPSIQSFARLQKYCQKYKLAPIQRNAIIKQCIRKYINNDTFVYDYYEHAISKYPLCYFLYEEFKNSNREVVKYLLEQVIKYAPELLL